MVSETNGPAGSAVKEQPKQLAEQSTTSFPETQTFVRLEGVSRVFGHTTAVDRIDLDIRKGEVFALLGASGCGKSTTLRMIAGLEPLDDGRISMDGRILAEAATRKSLAPERRNIAIVFQSYAVWPHMTVAENVAFPLKMRRVPRPKRRTMVAQVLELTGMDGLAERSATALSGGQQQRVALARALVYEPDLLLLDEPLSNLDSQLRTQMRREIRRLNQDLGVTMLFVTHDQDEAFTVADRVGVMAEGRLEQVGTPAQMYDHPETAYVRDFLGRTLSLEGTLSWSGEEGTFHWEGAVGDAGGQVTPLREPDLATLADSRVRVFFRPENVDILPATGAALGPNQISATVVAADYLGDHMEYEVDLGNSKAVLSAPRRSVHKVGDTVILQVDPAGVSVWPTCR